MALVSLVAPDVVGCKPDVLNALYVVVSTGAAGCVSGVSLGGSEKK